MYVVVYVGVLFRFMEYMGNTNRDIYPNSIQKPTDECSRPQDQNVENGALKYWSP